MGDFASRASTAVWRGRDRSVADTLPNAVYLRPRRPVRPLGPRFAVLSIQNDFELAVAAATPGARARL